MGGGGGWSVLLELPGLCRFARVLISVLFGYIHLLLVKISIKGSLHGRYIGGC